MQLLALILTKNMLEDACNTYFNDAIKEIDSKIANYQQYNATSTFAFAQHIHICFRSSLQLRENPK